jgi:N-acetylglutamate synthase/N-acetylornithine aminotransferase
MSIMQKQTQMQKKIAFSIANSPLVKTAIAGEDPNWGKSDYGDRQGTDNT